MKPDPLPGLSGTLAALPHFRELPAELLARVAALSREVSLAAGEPVFHAGQRCDGFYAVVEGLVRVYRLAPDGREQVLHHIGPGHTFAEAALFHHGIFPASAAAAEPSRLIKVDGARFLQLFAEERALASSMVGSLCGWLHTLVDRIEVLTLVSAGSRLAAYVLRLPAKEVRGELFVELPVAKKGLAAELSITPETLSRLLARWKQRGLVHVDGRRLALLDVRTLEAIAESSATEA
jgi:CRP/FNR family transcriptional regulator, dissimilatory nitrate respiration regulator